jgi:hypothetical protein
MLTLLSLAFAFASEPASQAPVDAIPAAVAALPAALLPDIALEARIDEAVGLRRGGDLVAARALLLAIEPHVPQDLRPLWLYQLGVTEELAWRPDEALQRFTEVIATDHPLALDARFRRALVREDLGDAKGALQDVLVLSRARGLDEDDAMTLALQRGITEVETGRTRRGIRRIERALAAVESGVTHRYMRAKARYTLARALLEEANGRSLDGGERRAARNLGLRARAIQAAESQIVALIALEEPEWILASLLALGEAYTALAVDLRGAPAPRRLSDEQERIYAQEVGRRADVAASKAHHWYDAGVELAARLDWESPRVARLVERREATRPR